YQRPTWPDGASGVTIGIGYDLGYSVAEWLGDDWGHYLRPDTIARLATACGITGPRAQRLASTLADLTISWDVAAPQFAANLLPRYVSETERALANTNRLSPDSL